MTRRELTLACLRERRDVAAILDEVLEATDGDGGDLIDRTLEHFGSAGQGAVPITVYVVTIACEAYRAGEDVTRDAVMDAL